MLLGTNNVGQVTIGDGEVTHRLFSHTRSGTRVHEATIETGSHALAALQRRTPRIRWRPGRFPRKRLLALFGATRADRV
jgi:hypothetical protein